MYLHIGQDHLVDSRNIIGIFDMDTATAQKNTRDFLKRVEQEGAVVTLQLGMIPKSFVLVDFPDNILYISPLAPATLKARSEQTLR